jgi:Ca-activated chloride channel homolog
MKLKSNFVRCCLACLLGLASAAVVLRAQQPQEGAAGEPSVQRETSSSQQEKTARDPNAPEESQGIRVLSNLVETPVTVTDSSGDFVYDLSEKDFSVFDNGIPQHIQNFVPESRPLAVVILIQTSDSVKPLLPQLQPLSPLFSGLLLGPQGKAAVITFDDRVRVAQDFSDSGDALAATMKKLRADGDKARLNDALARAIALLERRPKSERRIVIAFSDGFDAGSETSEDNLLQLLTGSDVTVYGLGFSRTQALLKAKPKNTGMSPLDAQVTRPVGPGVVPTPTNADNTYGTPATLGGVETIVRSAVGTPALDHYASYTGGVFHSHWSEKALQEQLSRVASEIHSQYDLAYVPDTLSQPGFHRIEVRVSRPGLKVRARAGYYYAASKP